MRRKTNPATDVRDRVRALYPEHVAAAKAYFGPVPYGVEPMTRERADVTIAQMGPQEIANLSITNPVAAEQAAQRLNLMDARAAASTPYSDIGLED